MCHTGQRECFWICSDWSSFSIMCIYYRCCFCCNYEFEMTIHRISWLSCFIELRAAMCGNPWCFQTKIRWRWELVKDWLTITAVFRTTAMVTSLLLTVTLFKTSDLKKETICGQSTCDSFSLRLYYPSVSCVSLWWTLNFLLLPIHVFCFIVLLCNFILFGANSILYFVTFLKEVKTMQ